MKTPTYRNQAAGEAAEAAVNRLTFNDRLVLWHNIGKKDLEEAKKRGWKQTLIGVGVAVAAAAAAAFGFTSCTEVTPSQVQGAHALYHAVSGKPCPLQEGQCTKNKVQIIK